MFIPKGKHRYIAYFMYTEEQERGNLFRFFARVRDIKEFVELTKPTYFDYYKMF